MSSRRCGAILRTVFAAVLLFSSLSRVAAQQPPPPAVPPDESREAAARPTDESVGETAPKDAIPPADGLDETEGEAAGNAAEVEDAEDAEDARSLTEQTLGQDIATASFYELVAWARRLGLSAEGDRRALQERLRRHYEVAEIPATESENEGRVVVIESAVESQYFTLEEIEERYVRLTGGVVLRMQDTENEAEHIVIADEVTFNQDRNTVTAYGDVHYTIERPESTEVFTGVGLTFELNDWSGVFVNGVSQRPREIEGESIDFLFSGEFITRSEDDVIELHDGSITSSQADPPNYRIGARQIWVFGRGEWGLRDAVLYVGRVPVLYFPFFFKPGDELFFHPSFGFRPREGNYFQTTTYLIGQKEEESSPLSFLQIAEEAGDEAPPKRIEGLFLVDEPDAERQVPSGWILKAMFDIYTRLGVFAGLEGSFDDLWFIDSLSFYGGLAASRNIYQLESGAYTGLWESDETIGPKWNESLLFGVSLPLRYALRTELSIQERGFSIRGEMTAYSDRQFTADFGDRAEDIDWSALIGLGEEAEESGTPTSSYDWGLTTSFSPSFDMLSPFVQSFRISRLSAALSWRSREVPEKELPEYIVEAEDSPDASFFYPQTLSLPTLQAQVSGTPLALPFRRSAAEGDDAEPLEPIRPPWPVRKPAVEDGDSEQILKVPRIEGDVEGLSFADPLSVKISYSLRPNLSVEWLYDDEPWITPDLIDFSEEYATFTGRGTGSVRSDFAVYQNLLTLGSNLTVSAQLRDVFDRGDSVEDAQWETLRRNAFAFGSQSINHAGTLSTTPIPDNRLFGRSNATYSLTTLLYRRSFEKLSPDGEPEYEIERPEWTEKFVQTHHVALNLILRALDADQTLSLTSRLPPLDGKHDIRLGLHTGPLTSTVTAGVQIVDDEWVRGPISVTESLSLFDDLSLRQSVVYDPEELWFTSSSTRFSYDWASLGFEAQRTFGYDFEDVTTGFVRREEEEFLPTSASIGLRPSYELLPFWRDRVTFEATADAQWRLNLLRFTNSTFSFTTSLKMNIHEFLSLTFSSQSRNSSTFIYIPRWAETVGLEPRNVFEDLLKSFNFFDTRDREESLFNVQRLSVSLDHDLGDWELSIDYSGRPEQVTDEAGRRRYEWERELSFLLQWKPIPELKSVVQVDEEEGILFGE